MCNANTLVSNAGSLNSSVKTLLLNPLNPARGLLNPAHASHGGVSYFAFVCPCVCLSVC